MNPQQFLQKCESCSLNSLCLSYGLDEQALQRFDQLKVAQKIKQAGQFIFKAGDKFQTLCVLRSGALKSYRILPDGREQITGFALPGELLGFDGLKTGRYQLNREFLATSSICEISFEHLMRLAAELPTLQHQLFCALSEKLLASSAVNINGTALQKMACFLLDFSIRLQPQHLGVTEFSLPMTRQDLANYLGLASETVTRLLSKLQTEGIIKINGRHLQIKALSALQDLTLA
jgi:CRP/FNR family transcriptional regulator